MTVNLNTHVLAMLQVLNGCVLYPLRLSILGHEQGTMEFRDCIFSQSNVIIKIVNSAKVIECRCTTADILLDI